MKFNWEKIFQLVKRTGDKLIVCDSATDSAVVVMDLDKYEKLLNRAEWGGDEFGDDQAVDFDSMEEALASNEAPEAFMTEKEDEKDNDDLYYLEPVA